MRFLPIRSRILFGQNICEFRRVENLTAELALNKLDVLFASDDADIRMFTGCRHMGEEFDLVSSLPMPNPVVNPEFTSAS